MEFLFARLSTIFVRSDLCRMNNFIESVFVEVVQDYKQNIVIGCIYRPPSIERDSVETFNSDFCDILKVIESGKAKTVLLAGDYNLDLLKCNSHGPTNDFLNSLLSYSYFPTITHPTRIADQSATLIDNIFVNGLTKMFNSAIIYSDISDHFPVAIHMALVLSKQKQPTHCKTRCYDSKSVQISMPLSTVIHVGLK